MNTQRTLHTFVSTDAYKAAGIDINANEVTILVHFRGTW